MDILNLYFDSLTFYNVELNANGFYVYVAALYTMTIENKTNYIIAFVPAISLQNVPQKAALCDLPWRNLQMRRCPKGTYKVNLQTWKAPLTKTKIPEIIFSIIKRENNYSSYIAKDDFPFELLLLHSPKKKTLYQYPSTVNIHWAIDQFNTIFNYIEKPAMTQLRTENQNSNGVIEYL